MELLFLLALMLVVGVFVLGAGAVSLVLLLFFKAIWFGVNLLFSLGWGIAAAVVIGALLFFKFAGTLLMLALIGGFLFLAWMVLSALAGGARRPAGSLAYEQRRSTYGGASMREATVSRLNAALNRMEERMADLEYEMRRRK